MNFHFNPEKAAANLRKHGVSFAEAATAFTDPLSTTLSDEEHSTDESRSILIGSSAKHRTLFVVYTEVGSSIRLIGARKATSAEKKQYEGKA